MDSDILIIILFSSLESSIQDDKISVKEEPTQGAQRPFNYDVVDVSKGFLTRIAYKKKKSSKLDTLLERRVKQHIIEEKQRQQLPASKPQTPPAASSASPTTVGTPVRPRSPLKPHALTQTQLILGEAVKVEETSSTTQTPGSGETEGESRVELSITPDQTVSPLLPSPVLDPTSKDGCSAGTCRDSSSSQHQNTSLSQEMDLVQRTMGPNETNSDSSGQEGVKPADVERLTAQETRRLSEQQTASVPSDVTKAVHIGNAVSEISTLKCDSLRASIRVIDQKSSGQNTSQCKTIQQNPDTLSLVHSHPEENGTGPNETQEDMQSNTPKSVSPLPQVNGNDGLGSDITLSNSVMRSNNGVITSGPQPKVNSTGKIEEQGLVASLKDNTLLKSLVNGDLASINESTEPGVKEPSLGSKVEVESKVTILDQDYKPPLKTTRLENNIEALGANTQSTLQHNNTSPFQSAEPRPSPVLKIIRMAPSPIPSAEESSLSDDFTEESSNSGTTEPLKTIITQVTTTSTTTVVSTETTVANTPLNAFCETVSSMESSAVSTLTTMTKTTVTKICSAGPDGHSEDSQSETVTDEQRTLLSASISKSTTDASGKTSVTSITLSQEDSLSTKGRIRLLKFSRTKKMRSDTALPSYCKFVTKSNRKSIFVLPHDDLKVLARRGGFREVPVFSYNAKPAQDIWPYPSPRPTFGITWR